MKDSLTPILDLKNVAIVPLPQYESLLVAINKYKQQALDEKQRNFKARHYVIGRLVEISNITYMHERDVAINEFIQELKDAETIQIPKPPQSKEVQPLDSN